MDFWQQHCSNQVIFYDTIVCVCIFPSFNIKRKEKQMYTTASIPWRIGTQTWFYTFNLVALLFDLTAYYWHYLQYLYVEIQIMSCNLVLMVLSCISFLGCGWWGRELNSSNSGILFLKSILCLTIANLQLPFDFNIKSNKQLS